ncbi:MAG: mechanosensitive ion channel family protein [Burkholderiaceae bacterium]
MNTIDVPGFNIDAAVVRLSEVGWRLVSAMPLLVLSVLLVWLAWLAGNWLSRRAVLDRMGKRNSFLRDLARTTVRAVVVGLGLLAALEIMDATALVGAVLGTAGVFGLALGFAFKETLENYLAGILMSLRQPFAPRDHLVIDGHEGVVVAMTSRATILMTPDGNHLRIPNALVFRSVTLNYTRNPSRRFEFDVGVGVGEDLLLAQRIGTDELRTLEGVMVKPPARAYINALGDSNVQLRFHAWVDQRSHDFLTVKSEAIRKVKLALERSGMDMPEPIYRVQLTEPVEGAARPRVSAFGAAPTRATGATTSAQPEPDVDTRAFADLQEQIQDDPRVDSSADLLDPSAPKE